MDKRRSEQLERLPWIVTLH